MQQISLLPLLMWEMTTSGISGGDKVRESSAVTIRLVLHPESGQFSLESPEQKVNISPRVVGSMFLLQPQLVWYLLQVEEKHGEKLKEINRSQIKLIVWIWIDYMIYLIKP